MSTAWGEIVMSVAATGALDVMGTPLVSLGNIKEDSLEISTESGDKLQLFSTGHVLVDELSSEDTLSLSCDLIGIEKATQFWEMDGTKIKSMVNSDNWSVKFASKVTGSDTFEAPKCKVKATPKFDEKEGWTVTIEVTVLKGEEAYFFNFGTVA